MLLATIAWGGGSVAYGCGGIVSSVASHFDVTAVARVVL